MPIWWPLDANSSQIQTFLNDCVWAFRLMLITERRFIARDRKGISTTHLIVAARLNNITKIRVMNPQEAANKALVIEAFDTLFNRRDYAAAEKFWLPQYIQHSAHIGPGREGLFDLIKNSPATLKWEHGIILAEDDYVIVHSRYSGTGLPAAWIVIDIVRIKDGILIEHWDVIQDEATKEQSKSGNPMFGTSFSSGR
jgi:predicted SnoaL-like aldol condensation-catalyzing enzyme